METRDEARQTRESITFPEVGIQMTWSFQLPIAHEKWNSDFSCHYHQRQELYLINYINGASG